MNGDDLTSIDQEGKNRLMLNSFLFRPRGGVLTSALSSGSENSSRINAGDKRKGSPQHQPISLRDYSTLSSNEGNKTSSPENPGNLARSSIHSLHHARDDYHGKMSETVSISMTESGEEVGALGSITEFTVTSEIEQHTVSVEVDDALLRFVKGKGGATQQQIERQFEVNVKLPSSKGETCVVIEGSSLENVKEAVNRINGAVEEGIRSPLLDYSHFVSLPLAIHPELVEKLNDFQNFSLIPELGIDKSIFIKPTTFHLTVLMLKLWNKERVAAAADVLQQVSSKVLQALDNRPLSIRLKGLECMKGSRAKARVLYAPVEEVGGEGRLMRACEAIIDAYAKSGLVVEKESCQPLKLHATLMNARHRRRDKTTGRREPSFDARNIFARYGAEDWGEYPIREVHLSQRFVFGESGYYHCCGSLPFPA